MVDPHHHRTGLHRPHPAPLGPKEGIVSKRARYDGPGSVRVFLGEPGDIFDTNFVELKHGEWLPETDKNGDPVKASVRNSLLEGPDWSEVKQSDPAKTTDKDGD